MSDLWREARLALRGLLKHPGFTTVALLTLTLGIGATTSIFTVVRHVLLEPLPYPDPDRLLLIQEKNPEAGLPRFSMSPLNFRDYREMSTSFEYMAARSRVSLALIGEAGSLPRQIGGQAVTADFLEVMGTPPALGRDIAAEDDRLGAPPVIILGHGLWQDLGGDPGILGSDLRIDGQMTAVIGVLPKDFPTATEALIPLAHDYESSNRGSHWLLGFGRLKPEVTLDQARIELTTLAARLAESYPASNTGWGTIAVPLHQRMVENIRVALWMLLAAVVLVLLIACANVAQLTLARVAQRSREIALRSALGASRGQLTRQLLIESLLLALAAGILGTALATRGTAWLVALNGAEIPRAETIGVDGGVLLFALLATFGTVLLFGLLPALAASKTDLAGALKEGGRGQAGAGGSARLRSTLVLSEVALALVVLIGAGLLIRSFGELLAVEAGFESESVWIATVDLPESTYAEESARIEFFDRWIQGARALPGVSLASTVMPMPLSGSDWVNTLYLEGEPLPEPNQERNANIRFVSGDYFEALAIPVHLGRPILATDDAASVPAIVVNKSAAEQFWNGQDVLGKRLSFGRPDGDNPRWYSVVGVVGNVHHSALDRAVQPAVYRSVRQDAPDSATIVLRTTGSDPTIIARPLRSLLQKLDPDLVLRREQSAAEMVANSIAEPRFNTTLLAIFAGLALILAAIGVFGVVSYAVSLQQREFGVRMALGARAEQIVSRVLGQALRPVLAGVAIGMAVALIASRVLSSLVYGISVYDPITYFGTGVLLTAVAALACLIPAWRVTHLDPMEALRDE